jgi:aminoglycoside 6'-N-acetyltransferase
MVALMPFVEAEHKELLINWLRKPHVQAGWGDPDENIAEVLRSKAKDTCALIMEADVPVGFVQWQWLSENDLLDVGLVAADGQTVDIDIFIGEVDRLGKGIGSEAIRLLMAKLSTSTDAKRATLFTGVENKAAIRAYEKCGFVRKLRYEDPVHGWTWLMVAEL